MHVSAFILELLKLVISIFELIFELFNLVEIGSDSLIEGLGQRIRGGLHACCCDWSVRQNVTGIYRAAGGSIVTLIASSGRTVRLKFVVRIKAARVLSVFKGRALLHVHVVGGGGGRKGPGGHV